MLRILSFSLIISLVSLIIVLIAPVTLTEYDSRIGPSPYRQELETLSFKLGEGLPPDAPEWRLRDELIEKNNAWFDETGKKRQNSKTLDPLTVWKIKNSKLALVIMLLWAVCFYFLIRAKPDMNALLVLVFPVLLTAGQLFSLLSLLLISVAVCGVFFYLYVVQKR